MLEETLATEKAGNVHSSSYNSDIKDHVSRRDVIKLTSLPAPNGVPLGCP